MANLTKAKRAETLKKWKAQGPALIQRPLKHIHAVFPDARTQTETTEQAFYTEARRAAARGNGGRVRKLARDAAALS